MRKFYFLLSLATSAILLPFSTLKAQTIFTIAGGGSGNGNPATSAVLTTPSSAVSDAAGNIYVVDQSYNCVRMINTSGVISIFAGTGVGGYNGDGIAATAAELNYPASLAIDASGNIYVTDLYNYRVRMINTSRIISTIAGTGINGYNGDSIPATTAQLSYPWGIAVDGSGNIYISDAGSNDIIRKISGGIITTYAGIVGTASYVDGPATAAQFSNPLGIALDGSGNLIVADQVNDLIREISPTRIVTTVAGVYQNYTYGGDGGPGASASFYYPTGVAVDASGNIYVADTYNNRIREISTGNLVSTVAGDANVGYTADGIAATASSLYSPYGVYIDGSGNMLIADWNNQRVRKVTAGIISTIAGGANQNYSGDGGQASSSTMNNPWGVALDKAGNTYFTDTYNNAVRMINKATGVITTIAGGNANGAFGGDGGPATLALLNYPEGIAVDDSDNVYISDYYNNAVRKIYKTTGTIVSIAGVLGNSGYGGDGGPSVQDTVKLNGPEGLAVDEAGNVYIADANNYIVRKITKATGVINTVAGIPLNGSNYVAAAPATANAMYPQGVAVDNKGNIYVADNELSTVWKVDASNDSSYCIGGTEFSGYDGKAILPCPATYVPLYGLNGVAADSLGNVYISDGSYGRICKINSGDTISYFAGTNNTGYNGDHIAALSAELSGPNGLALDDSLNLYLDDTYNNRIREIKVTKPQIISQPKSSVHICYGYSKKLGITVSGTGHTYQWYVDSTGSGNDLMALSNGTNFSGVTTDTLTISNYTSTTKIFQCSIDNGYLLSNLIGLSAINPPALYLYNSATDSICAQGSDGANISVNDDNEQFGETYSWTASNSSFSSTSYDISVYPTVTTTYSVSVNNTGCVIDTSLIVPVVKHTLRARVLPSTTVCKGTTITLYGTGGTGYYWSASGGPNTTTWTFTIDSSASFILGGTEGGSYGCQDSSLIKITVVPSPTVTVVSTKDSVCYGSSVTLTASGASTYSWSGGVSNGVAFAPSSSQVYNVTGTDVNGCSNSASVSVIVDPTPSVTGSASSSDVCAGSSITLTGNGASTYSWSGGVTNAVPFVPVASGTYTLTGTSTFGCTNTAIVAVTVNPLPTIGASAFPSATLCQGSSVALFGSGGASYAWSGGVNNGVSFTPSSSAKYIVTGIDANGCTNTDSVMVTVSPKVVPTITSLNTTCGLKNGVANVTASNGTPPYTYSWSTFPVSTNSSIDSLAPGTYVVTVSDSANCSSSAAVSIASSTAPILSVSTTNSNCGTIGTGSATVSVIGGTPPYRYLWNNGDTLPNDFNLKAATYIITVTDVNGCSTFAPGIVSNNNGPKITVTSQGNVKCFGSATGSIAVVVSGGTAPYSYNWSNGATTASISGLYAGPYQLTITDADSCTSVQNFIISQPASGVSITSTTTKADCGSSDGSAMASATGGVAPYTYAWSNGVSSASNTGIGAGVYVITITDANGCVDSSTVAVSDKTGPALALSLSGDATCGAGGLLSVSASGANPPYTYAWSTGSTNTSISNVPAGSYNVTVTDSHGCISTADTSVMEAIPPALSICMVTVDPDSSKHNYVIWDKSTAHKIASYNIYKESTVAGVYFQVASVPFSALGTYEDLLSDPNVRSWRYEISQVDSCGNESPLSQPHKTMHLTVNQGLGGAVNLIWDNYQGLAFSTYYIYRDTVGSNLTVIDSVPNNIFTYTDPTPPHSVLPLLYRIGISNPGGCTPSVTAINYNASKSNTGNIKVNGSVSVQNIASPLSSLQVYPNPSTGLFTVALTLPNTNEDLQLTVINALGQELVTKSYSRVAGQFSAQLDLSTIAKGVYFLKASYHNTNTYTKIVLQ